jgi:uncharacterized phage-associated protein
VDRGRGRRCQESGRLRGRLEQVTSRTRMMRPDPHLRATPNRLIYREKLHYCGREDQMAARLDSVCRFICERGKWQVSNLQLQKILYLAQMLHLGRYGTRLVDAQFEAWDYGPVEPRLYRKLRMFGAKAVQDVFREAREFAEEDPRRSILNEVCEALLPMTAGALVDMTHWANGAWAQYYVSGRRGTPIPDSAIAAEYRRRLDRPIGTTGEFNGFRTGTT